MKIQTRLVLKVSVFFMFLLGTLSLGSSSAPIPHSPGTLVLLFVSFIFPCSIFSYLVIGRVGVLAAPEEAEDRSLSAIGGALLALAFIFSISDEIAVGKSYLSNQEEREMLSRIQREQNYAVEDRMIQWLSYSMYKKYNFSKRSQSPIVHYIFSPASGLFYYWIGLVLGAGLRKKGSKAKLD